MAKRLSPRSTLDTLKTEAKRRLKAMRADDPAATLRGAQHTVARDYGFDGWTALKGALEARALARLSDDERADILLRCAWHADPAAQGRILARSSPKLARRSLMTAIVYGDVEEVRRRLADDPGAASRKDGPLGWEPILYLAFTRLPIPAAADHAVEIATALLDAGADPNTPFDDGWGNPFKPITGVIGHGEGVRPVHPQADALFDLLVARGANPFDTQALYDTSIVDDEPYWTARLYEACRAQGRDGLWREPAQGLTGRFEQSTLDYLLGNAVNNGHARRVDWLVAHGAEPNSRHAYSGHRQHTHALIHGLTEMADQLVRLGARPEALEPATALVAAALAEDRAAVTALLAEHPALLTAPEALQVCAERGRVAAVALLLDAGQSPDLATQPDGWRPLHRAAQHGSVPLARLLIDRGAEIDARENNYDSTPLGAASFFGRRGVLELLAPLSRDVFTMAQANLTERLAAVLDEAPELVAARRKDGRALLRHLPDDEDAAAAVARLLIARGADPQAADDKGVTALQAARARGLDEAVEVMGGG